MKGDIMHGLNKQTNKHVSKLVITHICLVQFEITDRLGKFQIREIKILQKLKV